MNPKDVRQDALDKVLRIPHGRTDSDSVLYTLLQKGVEVDAVRHRGLLCRVIQAGWFKFVVTLLRRCPALVDDVGEKGESPLHCILQSRNMSTSLLKNIVVRELFHQGADLLASDQDGRIPLHYHSSQTQSCLQSRTLSMWLYVVSRKLQKKNDRSFFCITPSTTEIPHTLFATVFQQAVCRLSPCLLRELSDMLG